MSAFTSFGPDFRSLDALLSRADSVIRGVAAPALIIGFAMSLGAPHAARAEEGSGSAEAVTRKPECGPSNTVIAEVVALDQVYFYNRFGAFNPAGLIYALRRDVVRSDDDETDAARGDRAVEIKGDEVLADNAEAEREKGIEAYDAAHPERDLALAGKVRLRSDKRARPLVLRVNEGDCLRVTFTNLINPLIDNQEVIRDPLTRLNKDRRKRLITVLDSDEPATRSAGIHVNGLDLADAGSDGTNVGRNESSLAMPGETRVYTWYAKKEGGYLMQSMGAVAGGEGDGGQLGLGLFGSVNVQPRTALHWYRSQVTHDELKSATRGTGPMGHPIIDYGANHPDRVYKGQPLPLLDMVQRRPFGGSGDDAEVPVREIVHSDLNAIIELANEDDCAQMGEGHDCGRSYREFTTIFHDEITAVQAFEELKQEDFPVSALRDGMAINYGAAGMGAMVLAAQKGVGPARDCIECKLEEFFLASWVNGDPAMLLRRDEQKGHPVALYPDDPSNVHHSYVGDPVRFRNMHAGPKETHVFHLHAHQWALDRHDPNSIYLDSQTIAPGAVFSYDIHYGGSGNRNLSVGDSIFHCHLYPHFAQGMWELWRSHDIFEDGTPGLYDKVRNPRGRALPDAEIPEGTPNPAVVPLPDVALPPMPSDDYRGYPFFIAGKAGHRPPQPPKDLDEAPNADTLQRHLIVDGRNGPAGKVPEGMIQEPEGFACAPDGSADLYERGRRNSACIAGLVMKQDRDPYLVSMARPLEAARIEVLPMDGTAEEKRAMAYHKGDMGPRGEKAASKGDPGWSRTPYNWEARGYPSCDAKGNCDDAGGRRLLFRVNGHGPKPGAPFADPCPDEFIDAAGNRHVVHDREYRAAYLQFDMTVNKAGWHDPQARVAVLEQDLRDTINGTRPAEPLFFRARSGECIVFKSTNLVPANLNLDDFQVFSPTDTIGQHIHLVKFDVTSSDGSGNGWNYEDGTMAADELRDRMDAHNRWVDECAQDAKNEHAHRPRRHAASECAHTRKLRPYTHPLFDARDPRSVAAGLAGDVRGQCPESFERREWDRHPWCGAQTTVQRWWADPLLNRRPGETGTQDRTIRTVFTHDHFGPSSHQQHGLYAALVVEPTRSKWTFPDGQMMGGADADGRPAVGLKDPAGRIRHDGGPTHYAANVIVNRIGSACVGRRAGSGAARHGEACDDDPQSIDTERTAREFSLAFADYALLYDRENRPVNPPNRREGALPFASFHGRIPAPEAISTKDPGSQLVNYRNEPIPLRIGTPEFVQRPASDPAGDMAHVFSSEVHAWQGDSGRPIFTEAFAAGRRPGDPATPLLRAFEGDRVQIRLIQGAQEENHVFSIHGLKWLSQPSSPESGYISAQAIGISEHFEFDVNVLTPSDRASTDYLYSSTATDNLWDGQWGLLRAYRKPAEATAAQRRDAEHPAGLAPLPGNALTRRPRPSARLSVCPANGRDPLRFDVTAMLARDLLPARALVYNEAFALQDPNAIIFFDSSDAAAGHAGAREQALRSGQKKPEPLILRAAAGDCIKVVLHNRIGELRDGPGHPESWSYNTLPQITEDFNFNQVSMSRHVSLHPQLVSMNTLLDDSAHVGFNPDSTVPPCTGSSGSGDGADRSCTREYTWYAGDLAYDAAGNPLEKPIEFGAIPLRDMADPIKHPSHGAIGALIIEPEGSTWRTDCQQASAGPDCLDAAATVKVNGSSFREFVLIYQDDLSLRQFGQPVPNLRNGDDAEDSGQKGFNYRTEPLWGRMGTSPADDFDAMQDRDWTNIFSSRFSHAGCVADPASGRFCDPETPLFTAEAGTPVRFRVVHAGGHPRNHGFTLHGHDWEQNPWTRGSTVIGFNPFSTNRIGTANAIGPGRHLNILVSAGGCFKVPGDYLYRTQEGFALSGGEWGLFRVTPELVPHPLPAECFPVP